MSRGRQKTFATSWYFEASQTRIARLRAGTRVAVFLRRATPMPHPACDRPSTRAEILIGRALALSMHPIAAWHLSTVRTRALIVLGYFAASYVTVSGALQLFSARH